MSEIWLVLGLLAVSTFALRAVGPVLLGGRELPARAADAVELLPPALFTALIVPQVFGSGEVLALDERAAGLAAAGVAVALRAPASLVLPAAVLPTRPCERSRRRAFDGHETLAAWRFGHRVLVALDREVAAYYALGAEPDRLRAPGGRLEFVRTQELFGRFLPSPPAIVVDVGGGSGVYALPLAVAGYEVHLLDPVELHVEQVLAQGREQQVPLAGARVGDAPVLSSTQRAPRRARGRRLSCRGHRGR
jgi:branched-subunit amino acid transport protein